MERSCVNHRDTPSSVPTVENENVLFFCDDVTGPFWSRDVHGDLRAIPENRRPVNGDKERRMLESAGLARRPLAPHKLGRGPVRKPEPRGDPRCQHAVVLRHDDDWQPLRPLADGRDRRLYDPDGIGDA